MTPRILFVDDEGLVLRTLSRSLQFSYEITTANSAAEAIELLDGPGEFDVVVTDVRMPDTDGLEMIEIIAPRHLDTRFIVLTGNIDSETLERARDSAHVFRFYEKPASITLLTEGINAAIESIAEGREQSQGAAAE